MSTTFAGIRGRESGEEWQTPHRFLCNTVPAMPCRIHCRTGPAVLYCGVRNGGRALSSMNPDRAEKDLKWATPKGGSPWSFSNRLFVAFRPIIYNEES